MWVSKVWPANALRFDKVSSVALNQTFSVIVEVEMLAMVVLRVIEVICGAHWLLIHTVELVKQVVKEGVKLWVVLDRLEVITLPVHNLQQSLCGGFLFGLGVGHLNLEWEMSVLNKTIKVSTVLCNVLNIIDEIVLNTVIRLLSKVMLLHYRVDLVISNVLDAVNIVSSRLVRGSNFDKRFFRLICDLLFKNFLGLSLCNGHNNVRQAGLLLKNAVDFGLLGLAVLLLELAKSILNLLNDDFSDGGLDLHFFVIRVNFELGGHQFKFLLHLFFIDGSLVLVLVILGKVDDVDLSVFEADSI